MAINDEQTDRSSSNYLGRPEELEMSEKDHTMAGNSAETSDNESSEGLLRKEERDIEAQSHAAPAVEHTVSPKKKLLFLAAWFFFNLALTISNKAVLGKAKFPWLLTTLHASATSIGCFGLMGLGMVKLTALSTRENLILLAFSVLFTVNIAISNVSLAMVSVPLHQIMRSTCPVVTILIYRTLYNRSYSTPTYLSMIPLIFGVGLATAGDYYCTLIGFLLTALGVILAAVKTVATNRLMTGSLALSAMEVLLRMSPLAAVQCVIYAVITGEVQEFHLAYQQGQFSGSFGMALLANAVIAFSLNMVSFQANKLAGALTMTVAGNVKQALTIALGIVLFNVQTGLLNAVGMLITLAGAAWYSKIELDNKKAKGVQ
ncbi:TPT-domain-containing protein [Hortaea werneckii]|nr:TPT-domain-containing protein [Hortaea werneckii]